MPFGRVKEQAVLAGHRTLKSCDGVSVSGVPASVALAFLYCGAQGS
jgi:hypothetical protein